MQSINLLILAARALDYDKDPDPAHWRTINGSKVHLDKNGNYDGGAGGKFNGSHHWGPDWKGKNSGTSSLARALAALAAKKSQIPSDPGEKRQEARREAENILKKAGYGRYDRIDDEPEISSTAMEKYYMAYYDALNEGKYNGFGRTSTKTLKQIDDRLEYEKLVNAKRIMNADLEDDKALESFNKTNEVIKKLQQQIRESKNWGRQEIGTAQQNQKMNNIRKVVNGRDTYSELHFSKNKDGSITFSYIETKTISKVKGLAKMQDPEKNDIYLRKTYKTGTIGKDGLIKRNKDTYEEELVRKGKTNKQIANS